MIRAVACTSITRLLCAQVHQRLLEMLPDAPLTAHGSTNGWGAAQRLNSPATVTAAAFRASQWDRAESTAAATAASIAAAAGVDFALSRAEEL